MKLSRVFWGPWTEVTWLALILLILLPLSVFMFLIIYLYPTRPFLDGPAQYILASLNFLISSSQANYLIRFDDRIHEKRIPVNRSLRTAIIWTLLLAAFFTLTLASLLAIMRIILRAGWHTGQSLVDSVYPWIPSYFNWLDPLVVVTTGYGYLLLAIVAWLSWVHPSTLKKLPNPFNNKEDVVGKKGQIYTDKPTGDGMRALYFSSFGDSSVLKVGTQPVPRPRSGEALVRVTFSGLNFVDTLLFQGRFDPQLPLPHINGVDNVGTVEAVGPDVDDVLIGQRVAVNPLLALGRIIGEHAKGGHAEWRPRGSGLES